ncbi:MAG: AMP-binding protein [Ignavibacteriaceae bacterium]|nr:AMP-binding protein [Ignavibacteriaceae bacterium]
MANHQTELTLTHLFKSSCARFSDRTALAFTDEPPISYKELNEQVNHLIEFLRNRGVEKGDKVAILGENSPHWAIAYFAVATMGAVVVPILPDFHTTEIHHILRHSGSKVIFVSERFYYKVEELEFSDFSSIILLDNFSIINPQTSKPNLRKLIAEKSKELYKIRNLVFNFIGLKHKAVTEDDVASIIYTSGTMGHSKGVMLTHKNLAWNAIASSKIPNINPEDRMLSVLPMAHVYECTLGLILPIMCGASVYYIKKPPTPAVFLPALQKVKPTAILTVPLLIEKIYKTRVLAEIQKKRILRLIYKLPAVRKRINKTVGKKLKETFGGQIRFFGIGGSKLSAEVEKFLREAEFPYAIGYGLTETSPLIAGSDADKTKFRSTGPVVEGLEVKIVNPKPDTGVGEIIVRGPSVMKGYYKDDERTSEVLSEDGWFHTGDLGNFDEDGYLFIQGRLKNVILGPSGENIYPEAIESIINRSDEVLESLVYDDNRQLVARVYLDYERLEAEFANLKLTETQIKQKIKELLENLLKKVNEQVSSFSRIARFIEQKEPFEKTATLKIKRYLYTSTGN